VRIERWKPCDGRSCLVVVVKWGGPVVIGNRTDQHMMLLEGKEREGKEILENDYDMLNYNFEIDYCLQMRCEAVCRDMAWC
jgi:hypothetical protein